MKERIMNLLSMCMQAEEKGHDCFFEYAPHVQRVEIHSYEKGWMKEREPNQKFYFYLDGTRGSEEETILTEAETYLKGLVEDGKHEID